MAAHFEPVVDANCRLVAPPPTKRTAIGGYPKVASYDMLGEHVIEGTIVNSDVLPCNEKEAVAELK